MIIPKAAIAAINDIPTPEYSTAWGGVKNDSGAPNAWLVISQLPPQISKTLPNNEIIKTNKF